MNIRNIEFKARVEGLEKYEQQLVALNPLFKGKDQQIDTYFNVPKGRLKLREGNIENALINYDREDLAGSKLSSVILYRHQPDPALKAILTHQLGVKMVVDKVRKIYFIENVKFHFDQVKGLGTFIEVEAIDNNGQYSLDQLQEQCDHYQAMFDLEHHQMIRQSYSDLLLENFTPDNSDDSQSTQY
jgi:predicted adenylyl cyclase CyaB